MTPVSNQSLVICTDVCCVLGTRGFVLGPLSFTVKLGERLAIIGPSGAGKSTLLKILSGEMVAQPGQILLAQKRIADYQIEELACIRAVLPQQSEVAFPLATQLVVELGRAAIHEPVATIQHIVQQAAALACCQHLLQQAYSTLSGGEKARVQLARVFAQLWSTRNGLLLVDEPLAALDPALQINILIALRKFTAERNHALVAVVHDLNHALQGFDRLLLLKQGQLVNDVPATMDAVPALSALFATELTVAKDQSGGEHIVSMQHSRSIASRS